MTSEAEPPVSSNFSLEREPFAEICIHHWVLGQTQGGIIPATCKKCGAVREYEAEPRRDSLGKRTIKEGQRKKFRL